MTHYFKYVTAETGRKIIENNVLRWSSPPLLNDPFDMQFAFQLHLDRATVRSMARDKRWQHYSGELLDRPLNEFGRLLRKLRDAVPNMSREDLLREFGDTDDVAIDVLERNIARYSHEILSDFTNDKIFCVTEAPDSLTMWTYYAQNHTGMVLRFTDDVPESPLTQARRIRYVDQMPSLFDNEMLSDDLAGYTCMTPERIMNEVVWTKSNHWAHEREWRIYVGSGRTNAPYEDIPFNPKELDGVIFGVRTADGERAAIVALIETHYPHANLLQAVARTDAYGLTFQAFDQ